MMAELAPPGFDNMVRLSPSHPLHPSRPTTKPTPTVLRPLRSFESRLFDDRAERDPGDHQQHTEQLEGVPVPLRDVHRR